MGKDLSLKRALCTLQRGPVRFYRDNVIVCDENEDAADYIFFVVSGVVRSCKSFENGNRNVVAFSGDLFGWTDLKRSLSLEAATDTAVLFLKRSALLSLASRESRVASFC